jgi:hypothetical protein
MITRTELAGYAYADLLQIRRLTDALLERINPKSRTAMQLVTAAAALSNAQITLAVEETAIRSEIEGTLASVSVTPLENKIILAVSAGEDPQDIPGRSRVISAAIGRAQRKGFIRKVPNECRFVVTETGRAVVTPETK